MKMSSELERGCPERGEERPGLRERIGKGGFLDLCPGSDATTAKSRARGDRRSSGLSPWSPWWIWCDQGPLLQEAQGVLRRAFCPWGLARV